MAKPMFSGPLDQHPLFSGIKEAATKATEGATKVAKEAAHKAATKPTPTMHAPVGAPLKGGLAKAAPAPKASPKKSPAFSPKLQSTFGSLAKQGVGAPAKLAPPKVQREAYKKEHEGGAGSSILGVITAPAAIASSVATDLPKELKGKGTVESFIKSGASSLAAGVSSEAPKLLENSGIPEAVSSISGGAVTPGQVTSSLAHIGSGAVRDIVELPAQVLPTLYVTGKALKDAVTPPKALGGGGGEKDFKNLLHSYTHESALGALVTGHPGEALKNAYDNPVNAALEFRGATSAADRAAGFGARTFGGPELKAKVALSDPGATTVSRGPKDLIGNVKAPQDPYSKRLSVRLRQGKSDPRVRPGDNPMATLRGKSLTQQLHKHFDKQVGTLEQLRRATRSEVAAQRLAAIKGKPVRGIPKSIPIPGVDAVNAFARGLLADPKILDEHGQPLYRNQLSKLIELHSKSVEGELPFQAHNRMGKVAEYQALLDEKAFHKNPHLAYAAAKQYAADVAKLDPELVKHDYLNPQSIRVAKLADPFQFHWQGHDPHFDEQPPFNEKGQKFIEAEEARETALAAKRGTKIEVDRARAARNANNTPETRAAFRAAKERHEANIIAHHDALAKSKESAPKNPNDPLELHESPFSIAKPRKPGQPPTGERIRIPIDQVEKELLEKHGVDPKNIGFVSNRPYQNESAAYYRNNTDPSKAGFNPQKQRTGAAFLRGQYDTSYDALVRQHLSNAGLLDQARGSKMQVSTYALTKEHLAKLLEEKLHGLSADEQTKVKGLITELRTGDTFFKGHGGLSGWDHALRVIQEVERLNPDLKGKLTPGRIAHPFAPSRQLDQIAKHSIESAQDRLDPSLWEQDRGGDRFPTDPELQKLESGHIGVYHKAIADRMRAYEKQEGSALSNLLRQPASWWRRGNVAFSVKHVPGLVQELGIRGAVNKIGPVDYLRGKRLLNIVREVARDPEYLKEHPEAAFDAARLQTQISGTVAHQTKALEVHVAKNKLEGTVPGTIIKGYTGASEHKIAGAPLRVVNGLVKGYSHVANRILAREVKMLERPAQIAGLGKHANDEANRMMGKSLPVFKSVTDVQRKMAEGLLSQEGMDAAARKSVEYWGEWQSASPAVKNVLAVAPFFNWFRNSLKFLYVTMPMHHPIKTALLTALEEATAEQRNAMGQGKISKERLEEREKRNAKEHYVGPKAGKELSDEEQGSIPLGGGYVANQQYYTPQGAVGGDIAGVGTSLLFPEFTGAYKAITGSNSFGETLANGKREPITDPGERALLGLSALIESFNPLLRDASTIAKNGATAEAGTTLWDLKPKKGKVAVDPVARMLGIEGGPLLGAYNAFKPFKTSKERDAKGKAIGGSGEEGKFLGTGPLTSPGKVVEGGGKVETQGKFLGTGN